MLRRRMILQRMEKGAFIRLKVTKGMKNFMMDVIMNACVIGMGMLHANQGIKKTKENLHEKNL